MNGSGVLDVHPTFLDRLAPMRNPDDVPSINAGLGHRRISKGLPTDLVTTVVTIANEKSIFFSVDNTTKTFNKAMLLQVHSWCFGTLTSSLFASRAWDALHQQARKPNKITMLMENPSSRSII